MDGVGTVRDMATVHQDLKITNAMFNALTEDLQIAMERHNVPNRVANQLVAKLAPMQRAIRRRPATTARHGQAARYRRRQPGRRRRRRRHRAVGADHRLRHARQLGRQRPLHVCPYPGLPARHLRRGAGDCRPGGTVAGQPDFQGQPGAARQPQSQAGYLGPENQAAGRRRLRTGQLAAAGRGGRDVQGPQGRGRPRRAGRDQCHPAGRAKRSWLRLLRGRHQDLARAKPAAEPDPARDQGQPDGLAGLRRRPGRQPPHDAGNLGRVPGQPPRGGGRRVPAQAAQPGRGSGTSVCRCVRGVVPDQERVGDGGVCQPGENYRLQSEDAARPVALEDFAVLADNKSGGRHCHVAVGLGGRAVGVERHLERQLARVGVVDHVAHDVAQKLTITTLPRRLLGEILSPLMETKVTAGATGRLLSVTKATAPITARAAAAISGLTQARDVVAAAAGAGAVMALLRRLRRILRRLVRFPFFFRDVLEDLDDLAHARNATCHFGADLAFALGHAALQEYHAPFGDDLERVGRDILGVHQAGFDLAGDQGVVRARGVAGRAGHFQLVDDRQHAFDGRHFAFGRGLGASVRHFAGQQHAAIKTVDVDVGILAQHVAQLVPTFQLDGRVFGLRAERAAVGCGQGAGDGAAGNQRHATGQGGGSGQAQDAHGQRPFQRVPDDQMHFLDAGGTACRNADMDVGVGQHLADVAAALAGQRHDAHFAFERRFDGGNHVARVTGRGKRQQDIARLAERLHLLGENLAVAVVVGDSRQDRGVGGEGNGRQREALAFEAAHQFGRKMLGVGSGTAVAAHQDFVAIGQSRKHHVDGLGNVGRQHGGRLDFQFGTFVEVRQDALIIHTMSTFGHRAPPGRSGRAAARGGAADNTGPPGSGAAAWRRWSSARSSPSWPSRCCSVRRPLGARGGAMARSLHRLRRAVLEHGRLLDALEARRALAEVHRQPARYAIDVEAARRARLAADGARHAEGVDAQRIQAFHVGRAGLHRVRIHHHGRMVALHLPGQVEQAYAVEFVGGRIHAAAGVECRRAVQRQRAEGRHRWRGCGRSRGAHGQAVGRADDRLVRLMQQAARQRAAQLARLVGAHGREQQARRFLLQARAQLHQVRIAEVAVGRIQFHQARRVAQLLPPRSKSGGDAALPCRTGGEDQGRRARLFGSGPLRHLPRFFLDRQAHGQHLLRQRNRAGRAITFRMVEGDGGLAHQRAGGDGSDGRARQRADDDVRACHGLGVAGQDVLGAVARLDDVDRDVVLVAFPAGHEAGAQRFGGGAQRVRAQRQDQAHAHGRVGRSGRLVVGRREAGVVLGAQLRRVGRARGLVGSARDTDGKGFGGRWRRLGRWRRQRHGGWRGRRAYNDGHGGAAPAHHCNRCHAISALPSARAARFEPGRRGRLRRYAQHRAADDALRPAPSADRRPPAQRARSGGSPDCPPAGRRAHRAGVRRRHAGRLRPGRAHRRRRARGRPARAAVAGRVRRSDGPVRQRTGQRPVLFRRLFAGQGQAARKFPVHAARGHGHPGVLRSAAPHPRLRHRAGVRVRARARSGVRARADQDVRGNPPLSAVRGAGLDPRRPAPRKRRVRGAAGRRAGAGRRERCRGGTHPQDFADRVLGQAGRIAGGADHRPQEERAPLSFLSSNHTSGARMPAPAADVRQSARLAPAIPFCNWVSRSSGYNGCSSIRLASESGRSVGSYGSPGGVIGAAATVVGGVADGEAVAGAAACAGVRSGIRSGIPAGTGGARRSWSGGARRQAGAWGPRGGSRRSAPRAAPARPGCPARCVGAAGVASINLHSLPVPLFGFMHFMGSKVRILVLRPKFKIPPDGNVRRDFSIGAWHRGSGFLPAPSRCLSVAWSLGPRLRGDDDTQLAGPPGCQRIARAAGALAAQKLCDELSRIDHDIEIDAGLDAEALHQVQHILGGDVAGGALGVRAAAQSRDRRVIDRDAHFQAGVDIGQRLAVRVVEVAGQGVDGKFSGGACHHRLRVARGGHADGVGDVDFIATEVAHAAHHVGHGFGRHLALVRAAERAADAAAQAQAVLFGCLRHAFEAGDRFGDRAVDVFLREGLGGGAENHHLVGARRQRRFKPLQIGRERGIDGARAAVDGGHDVGAGGHLRHPLGRHERRRFDVAKARAGQAVDQFRLDVAVDDFADRFAAFEFADFLGDLLHALAPQGQGRDVRRDGDARLLPERVLRGQRFVAEHVQRGSGNMACLDQRQQVRLGDVGAARHVDDVGAGRQLAHIGAVDQVAGVRRERQQADQHPAAAQEGVKAFGAVVALHAVDALFGAAPAAQGKAERRQRLEHPGAERAQSQHAHGKVFAVVRRQRGPDAGARLAFVIVEAAEVAQHCVRDVFRHLQRHAGVAQTHDGDFARQRVAVAQQRIHAGARVEDGLDLRQLGQHGLGRRPHHRVVARLAFFAGMPDFEFRLGQGRAIGHLVSYTVQDVVDLAVVRRGDGMFHLHRFHDHQRFAFFDVPALGGEHRHHLARHRCGEPARLDFRLARVGHRIVVGELVVCAAGKHVQHVAVAPHHAVHGLCAQVDGVVVAALRGQAQRFRGVGPGAEQPAVGAVGEVGRVVEFIAERQRPQVRLVEAPAGGAAPWIAGAGMPGTGQRLRALPLLRHHGGAGQRQRRVGRRLGRCEQRVVVPLDQARIQRLHHAGQRLLAVGAPHDQLGDHGIVVRRDGVAGAHAGVDAHASRRIGIASELERHGSRQAQVAQGADRRQKTLVGIFSVDARLDRMTVDGQVMLQLGQRLAGGHAQLPFHQVGAGDHFGDRVFHLQARVHLHEVERAVLVGDEFHGAGAHVTDRARGRHCRLAHGGAALGGHVGGGRFFEHLLVPALHRAIALEQVDVVAVGVGKHLDLDVARALQVFFGQYLVVAKGADRLALARRQRILELRRAVDHAHALAAAAGRRLEQHRVADAVGLRLQEVGVLALAVVAGHQGHVGLLHQRLGGGLGAHRAHGRCGRTDEHQSGLRAGVGKVGVLGQETVTGVDRLRAGTGNWEAAVGLGAGSAAALLLRRRVEHGAARFQAQLGQQFAVVVRFRVVGGEQLVAVKNRIGAGQEAHRLHRFAHLAPARRQAHARFRHGDAGDCNGAHEFERIERIDAIQRRAFHLHQVVDRHRFRVRIQVGQLGDQARALQARFAHAHDAAAAHLEARFAHVAERIEAVLVFAGGDHVVVKLGRRVQVMVVVIEAGVLQALRLFFFQHAQRGAGFQAQRLHFADHLLDLVHVAVLRAAPGGAHAEAGGAVVLGLLRRCQHGVDVEDFFRFDAGVVARGLRAVAAVFLAAARLDRQQRGQFDVAVREVEAVGLLRLEHQVIERQLEQRQHVVQRPGGGRGQGDGCRGTVQGDDFRFLEGVRGHSGFLLGSNRRGTRPSSGAAMRCARAATFSSANAMSAWVSLATQPASVRPRAAIASAVSSEWLMQPRRRPTTSTTGRSSCSARSAVSNASLSGTRKPPTPSTTTASDAALISTYAARMGTGEISTPAKAAAMCGAAGSCSRNGVVIDGSRCTLPAAASWSQSSLCHSPSRSSAPAATGFMPQARTPACTSACSMADDTSVLPISVSVPVTKQEKRVGMPAAATAAAAAVCALAASSPVVSRPVAIPVVTSGVVAGRSTAMPGSSRLIFIPLPMH
uniref:Uncharacterized protein n=1 Tax=Tanacetum cinerariifolium TaxID=118510 RepID=A0A699GEK1_TANCI|nr:conserved hypothetical protein [Tanacetum cinerariifolium]